MNAETKEAIAGLLKENTGEHFLDSGGAYGRHWQRNQERDFDQEPECVVKFSSYNGKLDLELTHNVYHWLSQRCMIHEELNELFDGPFREEVDSDDEKGWLELMEEFPEWLAGRTTSDGDEFGEPAGIYGENEPFTVNTYNHQSLLSQTLQYTYFTNGAGEFVILQVHGGCDVRGGYTRPRVFSVGHLSELDITDDQRGGVYCTGEDHLPGGDEGADHGEHNWSTDDGHHMYYQGSCGLGAGMQLEEYEVVDLDEVEDDQEAPKWEEGKLFIKDGDGYCPHCGAKLAGGFY